MIERRATWPYWLFNGPMRREWIETKLHIDNWVSFDCFQYKINGVVYKNDSEAFEIAREQEIMWDKLK